ncbi:MAG: hypothetical protein WCF54_13560, partial [Terracidiphilus sp.]
SSSNAGGPSDPDTGCALGAGIKTSVQGRSEEEEVARLLTRMQSGPRSTVGLIAFKNILRCWLFHPGGLSGTKAPDDDARV